MCLKKLICIFGILLCTACGGSDDNEEDRDNIPSTPKRENSH